MTSEGTFTDEERAAIKQRSEELKATKGLKGAAKRAREFDACMAAIDAMEGEDRVIAETLYRIVTEEAPDLDPKTMYGFPTFARDGKTIVFFQPASRWQSRYGTIAFDEKADLDEGDMWPTSFAVLKMTDRVEARLRELVRQAVS